MLDGSALSPTLRLQWTTSTDLDPILRGQVANTPIWEDTHRWVESFGSHLSWNVSVGTTVRLNLGRRLIKAKPSAFLDMVGLALVVPFCFFNGNYADHIRPQKPVEIVGCPAGRFGFVSRRNTVCETRISTRKLRRRSPPRNCLRRLQSRLHRLLGAFITVTRMHWRNISNTRCFQAWRRRVCHQDDLERFHGGLILGMSYKLSGGLYTSFDLVFALIFGRSLIYLLSGE